MIVVIATPSLLIRAQLLPYEKGLTGSNTLMIDIPTVAYRLDKPDGRRKVLI